MAIPCFHKEITVQVATSGEFGFDPRAAKLMAEANALVDEKQGNSADETHLHAMRGHLEGSDPFLGGRMETEEECRKAVRDLLDKSETAIVNAITIQHDGDIALKLMGTALHTCQDKAFHHFEEWPYRGLCDALVHAPNYMIAHGVRDLGIGMRVTEPGVGQYSFELDAPLAHVAAIFGANAPQNTYLGVEGFSDFGARVPMPAGPAAQGPLGTGAMIFFAIGRSRVTVPRRKRLSDSPPGAADVDPYARIVSDGAQCWSQAKQNTIDFMKRIRDLVTDSKIENGDAIWSGFIRRKFTSAFDWPRFAATLPDARAAQTGVTGGKQ
jgi:hypothetical protein